MDKMNNKFPLVLILVMQAFFSVNFGIMYFSLFVILQGDFQLTTYTSYDIVVLFMLLNGAIHFIATPMGDRQLDYKKMMFFCIVMLAVSNVFMSSQRGFYFELGLTLFTVSYGLIVTCVNVLIKNYIDKQGSGDGGAFSVFSFNALSANVGIFIGTIVATASNKINIVFSMSFMCNIIALLLFILFSNFLDSGNTKSVKKPQYFRFILTYVALLIVTYLCFEHPFIAYISVMIVAFYVVVFIAKSYFKLSIIKQRSDMKLFIYLSFFGVVFWVLYNLIPLLMMRVMKDTSYLYIFNYSIDFKAQWLGTLNTIIVIIFLFISSFTVGRLRLNYFKTFLTGYYLTFIAFILLFLSAQNSLGGYININYILTYIFVFSLAEVILQPIGYSFVNKLVPDHYKNYMLGAVSFSTIGFAPFVSGYLSKVMTPSNDLTQFMQISFFKIAFGSLGLIAAVCIIVLLIFSSKKAFKV